MTWWMWIPAGIVLFAAGMFLLGMAYLAVLALAAWFYKDGGWIS